jgi:uncharacterized membrane protein YkvA (DUF1232 family)
MNELPHSAPARPEGQSKRLSEIARQLRLAWRLIGDRRVPLPLKLIPLAALGYSLFPGDFDFVPFVGYGDDLVLLMIALRLFIDWSPRDAVAEHSRPTTVTTTYRLEK